MFLLLILGTLDYAINSSSVPKKFNFSQTIPSRFPKNFSFAEVILVAFREILILPKFLRLGGNFPLLPRLVRHA